MAAELTKVVVGRFCLQRSVFARQFVRSGNQQRCILSRAFSDKVTHTGQQFQDDDHKMARFINREKLVNVNFSEKLISEEPINEVEGRVACCDGGGGALGHPKVYINLDRSGSHPCGYCGLRFQMKHH